MNVARRFPAGPTDSYTLEAGARDNQREDAILIRVSTEGVTHLVGSTLSCSRVRATAEDDSLGGSEDCQNIQSNSRWCSRALRNFAFRDHSNKNLRSVRLPETTEIGQGLTPQSVRNSHSGSPWMLPHTLPKPAEIACRSDGTRIFAIGTTSGVVTTHRASATSELRLKAVGIAGSGKTIVAQVSFAEGG